MNAPNASGRLARLRSFAQARPGLVTALCFVVACSFPLGVLARVVVGGKTLSTAQAVPGINGFDPPPGAPPAVQNLFRVDAGASAWATEPWAELTDAEYDRGEWPLWNPYQAAGKPHAANTISATFDPLLLAVNLHATQRTWDLSIIAAFMLGSGATFLYLLWSLRLRRIAALAGAAAFSLSGFFAINSNNPFARGYIYLPILFLLVDKVLSRRSPPWTIGLALALALSVYVGMPEVSIFVVGAAVAYACYGLVFTVAAADRWRTIGTLTAAGGLALAFALPLLGIFVQYESVSFNTHKPGAGTGALSDPIRFSAYWAMPFLGGEPASRNGFGLGLGTGVRTWLGAATFAAAGLALTAPRRFQNERRVPFFLGIAGLVMWKVYGLPGSDLVGELPVLERLIFPVFATTVAAFALACAAAAGLDALLRGEIRQRRLLIVAGATAIAFAIALVASRSDLDLAPTGETVKWVGLAVGVAAAVLLAGWASHRWPSRRVAAGVVAAVAVVGEVFFLFPKGNYQERIDPYREPAFVSLARPAGSNESDTSRVFALDAKLFPETATPLKLYDIRALDALYLERYIDYIRTFVSPRVSTRFAGTDVGSNERVALYDNNPMFDLLGVRHVFGAQSDPTSVIQTLDASPDRQRFERAGLELEGDARDAAILENGDELRIPTPTAATAAELRFSYAVASSAGAPTAFVIEGIDGDGTRVPLWRAELSPSLGEQVWNKDVLDLRMTPGLRALVVRPEGASGGRGAWANLTFADDRGRPIGGQYRLVGTADGVGVYENLGALPRAFIVRDVQRVDSEAAALRRLRATGDRVQGRGTLVERFDPAREAVVEGPRGTGSRVSNECPDAEETDKVEITSYTPSEVRLRVDATCAGLLVLTDSYFPDWRATVDGRDADVLPTDVLFRGVTVPAGASTVVFRYQSDRFETGLWVAAIAATAAAAWLGLWALRRRRAHSTTAP